MSNNRKGKVLTLSVLNGEKKKGGGPNPPDDEATVEGIINDLISRKGSIRNLTVVVEEEDCFYCMYNVMSESKRSFLIHIQEHEFFSNFVQMKPPSA